LIGHNPSRAHGLLERAQVPEVRRVPLEGLALQVKLLRPRAPVAAFLAAMMEPPSGEVRRPGRPTI